MHWKKYEYVELAKATRLFSTDKLIGRGSFGDVFTGSLPSGEVFAIKKLKYKDGQWEKELEELIKDFGTVRHPNVVSLIGYCSDSFNRLLVSEFVPNKSLKFYLYGESFSCSEYTYMIYTNSFRRLFKIVSIFKYLDQQLSKYDIMILL